jgi:HEAT repeat protein
VATNVRSAQHKLQNELTRLEAELERCYAMITNTARADGRAPDLQTLVAQARELRSRIADVRDDLDRVQRHLARDERLRAPGPDLASVSTTPSVSKAASGPRSKRRRVHADVAARRAIEEALRRVPSLGRSQRVSIEQVAEGLVDDDVQVRRQAAIRLGQSQSAAALELLLVAAEDPSDKVRLAALNSLVGREDRRVVKLFRRALHDDDGLARLAAIRGLGNVRDGATTEALIELLDDADAAVRRTAAAQLGWRSGDPAVYALSLVLRDSEAAVRSAAAEALGALGDLRSVLPLARTLADPDPNVRAVGQTALRTVLGSEVDEIVGGKKPAQAVGALRSWWTQARVEKVIEQLGVEPLSSAERKTAAAGFVVDTDVGITDAMAPEAEAAELDAEIAELDAEAAELDAEAPELAEDLFGEGEPSEDVVETEETAAEEQMPPKTPKRPDADAVTEAEEEIQEVEEGEEFEDIF